MTREKKRQGWGGGMEGRRDRGVNKEDEEEEEESTKRKHVFLE